MPFKVYRRGEVFWFAGTVDGKRYRESSGTADRALAEDAAAKREWELRRAAVHGSESVLTFGAAVKLYTDAGKPGRHLLPLFDLWEHKPVKDIKPGTIKEAARKLFPKAKNSTLNRQVLTPAKAVINHAADLGLCSPIRVKKLQEAKVLRRAVGRDYIDAFMTNAPDHVAALALFLYQTAARISDATSLTWENVDLSDGTATFGKTKNGDPHVAYLTPEMVARLANLPKDGRHLRKVFGYPSRHSVYQAVKRVCMRAGLPYLATHQPGRHSFATEMIVRKGFDPKTTADRGNWKSVRLLLENYVHSEDPRAVIEQAFGTPLSQRKTK